MANVTTAHFQQKHVALCTLAGDPASPWPLACHGSCQPSLDCCPPVTPPPPCPALSHPRVCLQGPPHCSAAGVPSLPWVVPRIAERVALGHSESAAEGKSPGRWEVGKRHLKVVSDMEDHRHERPVKNAGSPTGLLAASSSQPGDDHQPSSFARKDGRESPECCL